MFLDVIQRGVEAVNPCLLYTSLLLCFAISLGEIGALRHFHQVKMCIRDSASTTAMAIGVFRNFFKEKAEE